MSWSWVMSPLNYSRVCLCLKFYFLFQDVNSESKWKKMLCRRNWKESLLWKRNIDQTIIWENTNERERESEGENKGGSREQAIYSCNGFTQNVMHPKVHCQVRVEASAHVFDYFTKLMACVNELDSKDVTDQKLTIKSKLEELAAEINSIIPWLAKV